MADPKKKKYGAKIKRKNLVNSEKNSQRSAVVRARKELEYSPKKDLQTKAKAYKDAKSKYHQKSAINMKPSPFKMIMGSKQKHDPNNFSQKDQSKMATIPGAGEKRVVGGTIGIGPGGPIKSILRVAAGAKPYAVAGKYYGDILKSGKVTNSYKGLISGIKNRITNLFN